MVRAARFMVFVKDGRNWEIVDESTGVVLATLKSYQWGRAWMFRIEGVPWVKDAGSFVMEPRIAYPGLVRSKVEALEVLRIVLKVDPKPEGWSRKYHQPGHGGSAINAPEETR